MNEPFIAEASSLVTFPLRHKHLSCCLTAAAALFEPSLSLVKLVEMVKMSLFFVNPGDNAYARRPSGCHHLLWRNFCRRVLTPRRGSGPMFLLICKPKHRPSPFQARSCLHLPIGHQAGAWLSPECSLIVALFPNALQLLLLWPQKDGSLADPSRLLPLPRTIGPWAQIGSEWESVSQTMANSMMSCSLCEPNSDGKTWKDSIAWIKSGLDVAPPLSTLQISQLYSLLLAHYFNLLGRNSLVNANGHIQ